MTDSGNRKTHLKRTIMEKGPLPTLSRRSFLTIGMSGLSISVLPSCKMPTSFKGDTWKAPTAPDDDIWDSIRAEFVTAPGVTYMNNASLGMPPGSVVQAVSDGYRSISEDPIQAKYDLRDRIQNQTMPDLASLLGCDVSEVVLTRNATESLHLAAMGLELSEGDHVILTSQEHPAGRRPWQVREAKHGVQIEEILIPSPLSSVADTMDRFERAITPRTRAIAFCHVTRGGHRYPVQQIADMARERGILTVVDGAQALGMFPVDIRKLGCDAYAASLHKWLLAPMGTGMLYIRQDSREHWYSPYEPESTSDAPGFDPPGTADLPLKAAVHTALSFANRIGLSAISDRNRYLSDHLKSRLLENPGIKLLSNANPDLSAPGSTIFEMDGVDALAAVPAMVEAAGIHIDEHQRDGHNAIRISTHYYNSIDQIEMLVEALAKLQ